jgi:hypothetical protein
MSLAADVVFQIEIVPLSARDPIATSARRWVIEISPLSDP